MKQLNIRPGKLGVFIIYVLAVVITAPVWTFIDGTTWLLNKANKAGKRRILFSGKSN